LSLPSAAIIYAGANPTYIDEASLFVGGAGNTASTGASNVGVGLNALQSITGGSNNTAIGFQALQHITNGSDNIALGNQAGALITGNNNIAIGSQGGAGENDTIRIGVQGTQTSTYMAGIYGTTNPSSSLFVVADSSGQLGTISTIPTNSLPVVPLGDLPGSGAITINTGPGLSGGQTVPLGGTITLANTGVTSLTGNADITVSPATGTGALTLNDTATSADTASTIVKRDSNGDFSATTITLSGTLSQLNLPATSDSPVLIYSGQQLFMYADNNTNFFSGQLRGNSALSGYPVISGIENTGSGVGALGSITSGSQNTALGASALHTNTSGSGNTAIGRAALYSNTVGCYNTAVGDYAMNSNSIGSNNIALGYQAGYNLTTGSSNIDIGHAGVAGDVNLIRIGTTQTATYLAGTVYANGVALTSDRNAKENFKRVDHQAVLAKVAALPVTQWNYKTDSQGVQHIGPMAQDFQAAFGLAGADDTHISVVDEGGVALAAIQGLNQKVEEQKEALKANDAAIQSLQQRLERLETLVSATPSQP
jgi:hypothetical protein